MPKGKLYSPYLYQRGGLWYFRWTYPKAICQYIGKRELRIALKTGYQREASQLAIALAAKMQMFRRQFERESAMQSVSAEQVRILFEHYLASALAEREHWRCNTGALTPQEVEAELTALRYIQNDTRRELVHHDYVAAGIQVGTLMADAGLPPPEDVTEKNQLARQMLLTDAHLVDLEIRRTCGVYGQSSASPLPTFIPGSQVAKQRKLTEVIVEFIAEQVTAGCWTDKTRQGVAAILRDLVEIIGDLPVAMMTKEVLRQYKQALMRLPPNRRKVKRYRDKTIPEILAMDDVVPISVKTVNDTLTTVSQLCGWAVDQGYLSANPVRGLALPDPRREDEQRNAFSRDQLKSIFLCDEFRSTRSRNQYRQPYQFWLPLLGLFTGARIEELASLNLADIQSIDGVAVVDINTHAGSKRVKTSSAVRQIALHPTLLELGFLDYVEKRRQQGYVALFPELSLRRGNRKGVCPSRWFARYLDRRGITDKELVFHSLRHNLIDSMKQSDAPEILVKELAGHKSKNKADSITFSRYGKRLRPEVQLRHLQRIDLGIDLTPLKGVWLGLMVNKS